MNILGISAFYHDSAACLVRSGRIASAAQEERFTRKKHDQRFPSSAIKFCLEDSNISASDLDYIAFHEKPFLKFERLLETSLAYAPSGLGAFIKAMPVWIKQKLWIKEVIKKETGFEGKVLFPEHHESHAASAFYPSPYAEAAFLSIDGVGEWATTSYGVGKGNDIEILADIQFPHSLGLLYSAFTYYMGFKVNSGEYKVMGLAPYGEPKYKDLILKELIDLKEDGSYRLNMEYFSYCNGLRMTNDRFSRLFGGPPREPESRLTQKEMDLARSVQEVTEEAVLRIGRHVSKETGQKKLCLAGGVALNCVANGKLLRAGIYDGIWVQPAAGDAGGAMGAALLAWYKYLGNERRADGKNDSLRGSLLGPGFSDSQIEDYLKANSIPYKKLVGDELPRKVADLIAGEKVIGWFQGRMEFGPRALGARSIIGDARSPRMQETMNLKIKFRESFRPFAPAVLEEKAPEFFELEGRSPYMLLVADVRRQRRREMTEGEKKLFGIDKLNAVRSDIPAVTHVDYSARVQTVDREANPLFHRMLSEFNDRHGSPVVINTSFNVRGEPIVCTPEDAYRCFMRTNMDYLVMGGYLLDKAAQKPLEETSDWKKEYELD
ncbi:MAG: carbamoyltransferase [Deltaproteobacteria bacterium]|nr:carbamoyltransferase [Deltaproteobacteria bacterium]